MARPLWKCTRRKACTRCAPQQAFMFEMARYSQAQEQEKAGTVSASREDGVEEEPERRSTLIIISYHIYICIDCYCYHISSYIVGAVNGRWQ